MAAIFPSAVVTQAQLWTAVNGISTTLSALIDNLVTTLNVVDTTSFPSTGYVVIDSEVIKYTGKTGTSFTGCTRGSDGTTAASHSSSAIVAALAVADHHNIVTLEMAAIEQNLSDRIGLGSTQLKGVDGTAALPTYAFASDTNNGLYYITTDTWGLSAGGTLQLTIAQGTVTSAAIIALTGTATLTIAKTTNQIVLGTTRTVTLSAGTPASSSRTWTIPDITADGTFAALEGTQTFTGTKTFSGVTTSFSRAGNTAITVEGDSLFNRTTNDAADASLYGKKIRGSSIVQSGDVVFGIYAQGYDGAVYRDVAGIKMSVDATPGSGDMPGRMSLYTTPDGSSTATEALRINNLQQTLHIDGTIAAPSMSFISDSDTGFRRTGSGLVAYVENGAEIMYFGGSSTLQVPDGVVGAPGVRFANDSDTGFWRPAANQMNISLGGLTAWNYFSTGTADATPYIPAYMSGGGGTAANALEFITQSTTGVAGATTILSMDYNGYLLIIAGTDGSSNDFVDVIAVGYYGTGGTGGAHTLISGRTNRGSPTARTYTHATDGSLKLQMASGTYTVRVSGFGIGNR